MNDFRTIINTTPFHHKLGLQQRVLTLGSCFAKVIGTRLGTQKVDTMPNPFGTVYNPHSIHKLLHYAIQNDAALTGQGDIQHQDLYLNHDFHSEFSSLSHSTLRDKINTTISSTHFFLKQVDWIILTYGTAWVYKRKDTNEIVSNCHKIDASQFTKSLLTPDEVIQSFENIYETLRKFNPDIKVILTVSPVRHIKDTLELNSVSKAVLRLACYHLSSSSDDNISYFPAYEIMVDDLRDYRFYNADMIHPSTVAEDYIWEKFLECYANPELKKFLKEWQVISTALAHRPFQSNSVSHQKFLKDLLKRLENFEYVVNTDLEKKTIKDQLIH